MMSAQVHGLKDLHRQLRALKDDALGVKLLARAARKAFMPVLEAAIAKVRRRSGELAENIKITVKRRPKGEDEVVVVGIRITGKPASRWHFVELGTSKMAAHPYLRPALDENAPAVIEALKVELAKGIKRVVRKREKARFAAMAYGGGAG
jgi:HK97 gp10 family phage protein